MNTLTWKTERRAVADLIPADYNPRKITDKERQDLEASIKEFGIVGPLVVNVGNKIIGGHQRASIYADLGIREIEVLVPDRELTTEEEMRLNIRLNKNSGEWDFAKMKDLDMQMLLDVGFTDEELRVAFGVDTMEAEVIDPDRLQLLTVQPPGSPKLKDRAFIEFAVFEDYQKVKAAVLDGRIKAADILKLL